MSLCWGFSPLWSIFFVGYGMNAIWSSPINVLSWFLSLICWFYSFPMRFQNEGSWFEVEGWGRCSSVTSRVRVVLQGGSVEADEHSFRTIVNPQQKHAKFVFFSIVCLFKKLVTHIFYAFRDMVWKPGQRFADVEKFGFKIHFTPVLGWGSRAEEGYFCLCWKWATDRPSCGCASRTRQGRTRVKVEVWTAQLPTWRWERSRKSAVETLTVFFLEGTR